MRSAFLRPTASLMRVWCKGKALDVARKGRSSSCFGGAEGGNVNVSDLVPHWVDRGTGTPKDRDEVNEREVCGCDG